MHIPFMPVPLISETPKNWIFDPLSPPLHPDIYIIKGVQRAKGGGVIVPLQGSPLNIDTSKRSCHWWSDIRLQLQFHKSITTKLSYSLAQKLYIIFPKSLTLKKQAFEALFVENCFIHKLSKPMKKIRLWLLISGKEQTI